MGLKKWSLNTGGLLIRGPVLIKTLCVGLKKWCLNTGGLNTGGLLIRDLY